MKSLFLERFKKFKALILVLFLFSSLFSQISLDINLLNTAQYTLTNFNDPNLDLWTVNVINNYPFPRVINLEVTLNYNEIQPAIWAVTYPISLGRVGENNTILLRNSDFIGAHGQVGSGNHYESQEFINMVEDLTYLPAGDFQLIVRAYFELDDDEIDASSYSISSPPVALREISLSNSVSTGIALVEPTDNTSISEIYPWFRWDSPGFSNGANIDYRLYVYQYNPNISSNPEDALSNDNQLFFDSGWGNIFIEDGSPQLISIQYPTNDRELACGYQYVWKVEAREIIESMNNEGIWGWPEPITSPTYIFTFGSDIKSENILSPNIGSEVTTVRPIFNYDGISCADSYEIWLSNSEDTDIENPIWKSESIQSTNIQYPTDAIGLVPGKTYFWKIRINPDSEPGPWSEKFSFTISNLELSEPLNSDYLNTINPIFNINSPLDIASFNIRISDLNDPDVAESNIFNEDVMTFPFTYPNDASISLAPNETYFWKVIAYDESGNMVGNFDDYSSSSFSINSINLLQPSNSSSDISITPTFSWDSPLGISAFKLMISDVDDPEINTPFFSTNINGTYFQYSQFSEIPLEHGSTYYWSIAPIDNNENLGNQTNSFTFNTVSQGSEAEEYITMKPEFLLSLISENDKAIKVNIIEGIANAEEYLVYISNDQSLDNIIDEIILSQYENEAIFPSEITDWGISYYIQVIGLFDGELIGEPSNISIINTPLKPGSEDQVVFIIDNSENLIKPKFEITNLITNATDYLLSISSDNEMSEIIYEVDIVEGSILVYPDDAPILEFGSTYYFQISGFDDDGLHGISSSVFSLYIPSIVPPILSDDLFSWEATNPASEKYRIEISLTEDFSNMYFSDIVNNISYDYVSSNFSSGTGYYWRIQGLDENGIEFGNSSSIGYFMTEIISQEVSDDEVEGGEVSDDEVEGGEVSDDEVEEESFVVIDLESPINSSVVNSQQPTFKWINIENADKYEIIVCSDIELSDVLWNSSNIVLNEVRYPSLGSIPLQFNTTYYWSVRPFANNVLIGEFVEPYSFSITSDFTPILEGPINEISESIFPYFTWSKIQYADKYEIILGTNEDLSHIIYSNNTIIDNVFQFPVEPPLSSASIYYWKIGAFDSNGEQLGDYSNIKSFTTPSGIIEIEFIYEEQQ